MPFRRLSLLLALCLTLIHGRVDAGTLENAEAALRAGNPVQAQRLLHGFAPADKAQRYRADWALALALLRQGESEAAIALLERLVAASPDENRIRLELARAYFITGRDAAARRQFNAARAGRLAPGEAEAVDHFLANLDQRKTSESYIRFALVPETNAVRRTAAETIFVGTTPFTINTRARSGTGLRLAFGHAFTPQIAAGWRARLGAHLDARLFRDKEITSTSVQLEAGVERQLSRDARLGAGLLLEGAGLAGRPYSTGIGGYLSYGGLIGRGAGRQTAGYGQLSARVEVLDLRFSDYRASDGVRAGFSLHYKHAISPRMALSTGLFLARANAAAQTERSRTAGLSLGVDYAFDGGLVVGGNLSRSRMRRDAGTRLFPDARRDDLTVLGLRAFHSNLQVKGFAPTLDITLERRKSNLAIYEYRNFGVSFGLTRRF